MIAMALVHNPALLIADEPTTALDVTVQAQILELIDKVKREFDIGVILITHDLGVVAETAQTRDGHVRGPRDGARPARSRCSRSPQHPYTWGLLESIPSIESKVASLLADRGLAAVADPPSAGLPVPSALPAPLRAVRQDPPVAHGDATEGHLDACHLDAEDEAPALGERGELAERREAGAHERHAGDDDSSRSST